MTEKKVGDLLPGLPSRPHIMEPPPTQRACWQIKRPFRKPRICCAHARSNTINSNDRSLRERISRGNGDAMSMKQSPCKAQKHTLRENIQTLVVAGRRNSDAPFKLRTGRRSCPWEELSQAEGPWLMPRPGFRGVHTCNSSHRLSTAVRIPTARRRSVHTDPIACTIANPWRLWHLLPFAQQ
jgi:hypothetical protein